MVSLDDVKDLVLYNRPFFLPIVEKDKTRGSAIMLLTPNYKSSINCMRLPYTINRRYFQSYYIEKSVHRYISNEQVFSIDDNDNYIWESDGTFYSDESYEFPSIESIEEAALNEANNNHIDGSITSASGIIMDDKGRILVLEHKRTNTLSIPGGKFIYGKETPEDGLLREIKEEVNIDVKQYSFLYDFTFSFQYNDTKQTLLCKDFLFKIDSYTGEIKNNEPNKHNFVKFMSIEEILKYKGEKSKILSYFLAKYGPKLANTKDGSYIKKLDDKFSKSYKHCVLSGYEKDIKSIISKYNLDALLDEAFYKMRISFPNYLFNITCSSNGNDIGYMDERNLILLTKTAFEKQYTGLSYGSYIKYSIYLFTITYYNPKVFNKIAEPSAFVLSGLLIFANTEDRYSGYKNNKYDIESVF